MSDLFAVVYHRDLRLDVPRTAPAIAAALHRNIYDARHLARYARGIVEEEMSREDADALVAALAALGVEAVVIPQSTLPVLPSPRRIQDIECAPEALRWKVNFQQPSWTETPWPQIVFMSVGIVASPHYKDFLSSDGFKAMPMLHMIDDPEARREVKERLTQRHLRGEAAAEVDLSTRRSIEDNELKTLYREQTYSYCDLLVSAPLKRLRINRHDCHFDTLGPRMKQTSLENFRLLVEDIARLAVSAHLTDITRAYLDGIELNRILFESTTGFETRQFDRYQTWALYRAGQMAPSPPHAEAAAPPSSEIAPPVPPPVDGPESPPPPMEVSCDGAGRTLLAPPVPSGELPTADLPPLPPDSAPPTEGGVSG
ncbi:MAG: hypothetical protein HYY93_08145 [Planctomycetes bacterium]|nr:hypothetical protein [Planctomycetota bacterium]